MKRTWKKKEVIGKNTFLANNSAAVRYAKGGKSLLADHLEEALYKKSAKGYLSLPKENKLQHIWQQLKSRIMTVIAEFFIHIKISL